MRKLRAAVRLILFALWCAFIPLQWLVLLCTKGRGSLVIPLYWHKGLCALFGIKVEVEGTPVRDRQAMFVANHLSYLDITVISSIIPYSFVAKAEVARWPLFGTFARLQQTAFTSRSRRDAAKDKGTLEAMIAAGKSLIVFPEGTSSDGSAVLPFKSTFFSVAVDRDVPLTVQPFTIALVSVDGQAAVTSAQRDLYAWHGDMTMMPHLLGFAGLRGAQIKLIFHDPLVAQAGTDRKSLARLSQSAVAEGLARARGKPLAIGSDPYTLRPIKENEHEFFDPGSQPAAELPANQIRQ